VADAPEIKVKLTAEDQGVSAAIKELTSQLKTLKKQQDETATSGFSLAKAFQGIAAGAALIGLARIGKEAFDSAINIGKMADKTGISTQALSVFHHVAEELGVSTESVDKALTRAAKSITEFQAGGVKAAQGFKILGITQKDFVGLKSDEKIALITTRLGGMAASFQKATAAQLIFSRGGAEFIPVANAIAGEGFDKVTKSVSKLGLLLDKSTTDDFRVAKGALQELQDVGTGMATQFEAGLLPAITDVGLAFVDSLTQGGVSFQDLGRYAGNIVRGIALVFLGLGQTLGTVAESIYDVFSAAWKEIKTEAETDFTALGQAARGHLSQALDTLAQGGKKSNAIISDEVDRQKAIYKSLIDSFKADYANLVPSDAEAARRRKELADKLRPGNQTKPGETTAAAAPTDAAARAALALLEKQLQDELAIHRAYAKQTEQVDVEMFAKGEVSLKEYYDRRKTAVTADAAEEVEILRKAIEHENEAAKNAALARAKAKADKDVKGEDKQHAIEIQALTKVEELQTKIHEIEINASTKIQALDTEEFKKREENQQKILEFHKLIDTTQGKGLEAAKAEIAIEQQKLQIILAQSGASQAEIDRELARYAQVKMAEAAFSQTRQDGANATKLLDDQRAAIEDKVRNGKLFQVQADQQILDLYRQQIPALQQIADKMKETAKTEEEQVQAEDYQKKVDQLKTQANTAGQQIATIKAGLAGSLNTGLNQFFTNMVQGTQSIGQAFKSLASSVLSSIAQMIAQMLIQIMVATLLKAAMAGMSGGGLVPSVGGGAFAEGGLIQGPGGPKSDSIPARVSAGEYIVKADAVDAFGVQNLEAINRGLKIPSIERLALPKFADGGLVGSGGGGGDSNINLGIGLDEGLILKHLSSKAAGNIILQHLTNNPKAAGKALSRSD
jgi:hypothetical protein